MKNHLLLFALCLIPTSILADHVNEERAAEIAQKILGKNTDASCKVRRFELPGNVAQTPEKELPYYIFKGDEGFAIISAEDCVEPVLGYSQDHTMGNEIPCGMKAWLKATEQYINDAKAGNQEPTPEIKEQWIVGDDNVGRPIVLIQTAEWNQGHPYNMYCPAIGSSKCLTGCVATAHAIVMYHHKWPKQAFGKTSNYTSSEGAIVNSRNLNKTYEWDKMAMNNLTDKDPAETKQAVAQLMADLGAALMADYGLNATAANFTNKAIQRHFNYQGYYADRQSTDYGKYLSDIILQLNLNKPVITCGDGHEFVIDGYTDQNYFHINWGWGGYSNGYFRLVNPKHTSNICILDFEPDYEMAYEEYWKVFSDQDGRGYPTLDKAFSLATGSKKYGVKLLESQEVEPIFSSGSDFTIDLNGYDLTFIPKEDEYFSYVWNGTLTFTDTFGKGTVKDGYFYSPSNGILYLTGGKYKNCHLSIEGGCLIQGARLENDDDSWGISLAEGSETEIESSTLVTSNYYAIDNNRGVLLITNSAIEHNNEWGNAICAYGEHETILDNVHVKSANPLYTDEETFYCIHSLFTNKPNESYISPDCTISTNTDPVTKDIYPYLIDDGDPTALLHKTLTPADDSPEYISLSGLKSSTPHQGVNIINGKKVFIRK